MFKFLLIFCILFSSEVLANCSFFDVIDCNDFRKYKVAVGYSFLDKQLKCSSYNKQEVLLDLNNQIFKYFSEIYKEYKIFLTGSSLKTYFIFRSDSIWYKIGYGLINNIRCELSSEEEMISIDCGYEYNVGMWFPLFPYTIVSDAVLLGLNNYFLKQNLDFLNAKTTKYKIDTDLNLYEFSFSVIFSKYLSKILSLNYGLLMSYKEFSIIDKYNYFKITGSDCSSSVQLGTTLNLTKRENINIEVSFSIQKELNIHFNYLIKF